MYEVDMRLGREVEIIGRARAYRYEVDRWVLVSQAGEARLQARMANISRSGCRFSCMYTLDLDKPVMLRLKADLSTGARLVWSGAGAYGCQFDANLSDKALLSIVKGDDVRFR